MSAVLQLDQSSTGTKDSFLSETISDYGVEAILTELIELVSVEYLDQVHCAVILAYLIPAKNYIAMVNNRENSRLEINYPSFFSVEVNNG
ncbi:hypothetical protein [Microcystis aeruginosa]|uniref:Uncharacterized protein n=1 Tax=Microcystis aeruginosa NIES-3787 TaxID=2517782 RepID=A0A6H9GPW5_MICAE|nr:hypothetical protein [Microcystis aeruginosa]GCL48396.1 hypothetical protein NIES3787_41150 [Microcystis aeruginosa NIES-3787]